MSNDTVSRNEYTQLREFISGQFKDIKETLKNIGSDLKSLNRDVDSVKVMATNALANAKANELQIANHDKEIVKLKTDVNTLKDNDIKASSVSSAIRWVVQNIGNIIVVLGMIFYIGSQQ